MESKNLKCPFCGGNLGVIEEDKSLETKYRTCLSCNHQWNSSYFAWIAEM